MWFTTGKTVDFIDFLAFFKVCRVRKRSISCPYSLSWQPLPLIAGVVSYDRGSRFSWFPALSSILLVLDCRAMQPTNRVLSRGRSRQKRSISCPYGLSYSTILCTLPVQMEVYSSPQCRWTSVYTHSGTTVGLHFPRVFSVFGDPKTVIVGKCHPMSCNRTWKSSLKGKTAHFS